MTDIELANTALSLIRANAITSFTEGTREASASANIMPVLRDEMLREHNWRFSKKQAALAQLVATPLYGYLYNYAIPDDCLKVLETKDDSEYTLGNQDDQRVIRSDETTLSITYVSRVTNPTLWDSLFVSAYIRRLAAELAIALGASMKLHQLMVQEYVALMDSAMATDSIETGETQLITDTLLVDVRH